MGIIQFHHFFRETNDVVDYPTSLAFYFSLVFRVLCDSPKGVISLLLNNGKDRVIPRLIST